MGRFKGLRISCSSKLELRPIEFYSYGDIETRYRISDQVKKEISKQIEESL